MIYELTNFCTLISLKYIYEFKILPDKTQQHCVIHVIRSDVDIP